MSVSYIYSTTPSSSGPSLADNTDFEHHLWAAGKASSVTFPAAGGNVCSILDVSNLVATRLLFIIEKYRAVGHILLF
jgi:hypothetical protein